MVDTKKMATVFLILAIVLAVTAVVLNVTTDKLSPASGTESSGNAIKGNPNSNIGVVVNSPGASSG